jgi:hypothetical protein
MPHDLTFFRGIAVSNEEHHTIVQQIKEEGFSSIVGTYNGVFTDRRHRLEELLNKPDLSTEDTHPSVWIKQNGGGHREYIDSYDSIYACGEEYGASYYACQHNYRHGRTPILIQFKANIKDVQIDGRDFLYNFVFQAEELNQNQRVIIREIWGNSIDKYIDKALETSDRNRKIAICDLAVQDEDLILAHHRNQKVIAGRSNTHYRSSFIVKIPIVKNNILNVSIPTYNKLEADITIVSFRSL